MGGQREGLGGGRRSRRRAIVASVLAALLCGAAAQAQPYGDPRGYDRGPPPGYDEGEDYRGGRAPPRRVAREPVGLNCAAVQQGITGPQPYSCPLPGPRPIDARCFCDLPIAAFSPPQTAVGRVVR